MGRNRGTHQRTKDNARPSSSGRSAELLTNTGTSGFIGFNSLKSQHLTQDADDRIDGAFSMVMKKMQKRDSTTKLKAVQEFADLCDEKDKDSVIGILPFWPRLYNKLALDTDRRIREVTQQANAKLINKVKREIAPHLKSLIGAWLISQCDVYAPASSVASATFSNTFPENKKSEALRFCQGEILQYVKDCLYVQTPQSLSEPNSTNEEKENKYVLVVTGCLRGLKLLVDTLSPEDQKSISDEIKNVVQENKFWKFPKNKILQVRVAWYELVSCLSCNVPNVFENLEHKLGITVLGSLSESDPLVARAMWEAALHYVAGFENCWNTIDVHKVVLPELWTLLKGGWSGNASLLFPCLLPFLSKLPMEKIKNKQSFFMDLFSSIRKGLYLENVKKSTMECNAMISSFMECLLYVCLQVDLDGDDLVVINDAICKQLFPLLESSFTVDGSHLPVSKFYPLVGKFLQSIEAAVMDRKNLNIKEITEALQAFWVKTDSLCHAIVENEDLHQNSFVFLAYLFHCLYDPQSFLQKAKLKVSFTDKVKSENDNAENATNDNSNVVNACVPNAHREELFECTVKVCIRLLKKLQENLNSHTIKLLTEILSAARSPKLFTEFLGELSISMSGDSSENDGPMVFFQHFLKIWLQKTDKNMSTFENIIDISFIVCSCSSTANSLKILDFCCEVENPEFLKTFLGRIFKLHREEKIFDKFLISSGFVCAVKKLFKFIAQKMIIASKSDNLDSYYMVLNSALDSFFQLELCFDLECIEEIFTLLKDPLEQVLKCAETRNTSSCRALEFVCDVVKKFLTFSDCWTLNTTINLVLVFFNLNFLDLVSSSEVLHWKVSLIWQILIKEHLKLHKCQPDITKTFIYNAAEKLHNVIISCPVNDTRSRVVDITCLLITRLQKELIECDSSYKDGLHCITSKVMEKILPTEAEWKELRSDLTIDLLPSFFHKKIFFPLSSCEISMPSSLLPSYLHAVCTVSDIFISFTESDEASKDCNLMELVLKHLCELLWALSYCESHNYLIKEDTMEYCIANSLERSCLKLIKCLPKSDFCAFGNQLLKMEDQVQWCLPLGRFLNFVPTQDQSFFPYYVQDLFESSTSSNLALKCLSDQVLIKYLPVMKKSDLLLSLVSETFVTLQSGDESDCLYNISKMCCCLSGDVMLNSQVYSELVPFVQQLLHHHHLLSKETRDENYYTMSLQISFLVTEVILNDSSCLSLLWLDILKFLSSSLEHLLQVTDKVFKDTCVLLCTYHFSPLLHAMLDFIYNKQATVKQSNDECLIVKQISKNTLNLFLGLSETCANNLPKGSEALADFLAKTLELIPDEILIETLFHGESKIFSISAVHTLEKLLPVLTSNVRSLQLGVHSLIIRLMHYFSEKVVEEEEEKDEEITVLLNPLVEMIKYTTDIVQNMLLEFRICDCCVVLPHTDSYTYTSAYLFTWSELFQFYASSTPQERSVCATYLENNNLLSSLLSNLFRLIPENPLLCYKNDQNEANKGDILKKVFCNPPSLLISGSPSVEDLHHFVCYTYYSALTTFPALVRTWWKNLDKQSADNVNSFTLKYVSPLISAEEIKAVNQSTKQSDGMQIKAHSCSREVVATYTIDGSSIELVIQLPSNYPLGPCSIEKRGNVKLSQQQWRHWLMQLTAFLTYQNGSILDGLSLWKRNLDKKFDGVEECPICYFILHMSTAKLPNRSCSTCKKKFHAECMRKWFITSNNSTCPLCRNLW